MVAAGGEKATCTIFAGHNGAGKTTFALSLLANTDECQHFVNVDLIAAGLSPLSPQRSLITAGRLFLQKIEHCFATGESFAFETTLAGKSYLHLLRRMAAANWHTNLYYLWLPDVEMCVARVQARAKQGGHDVPRAIVVRRYRRSVVNFLDVYQPLCNVVTCLDNSNAVTKEIFVRDRKSCQVKNKRLYNLMLELKDDKKT